jgi:hypothetical protein
MRHRLVQEIALERFELEAGLLSLYTVAIIGLAVLRFKKTAS